MVTRIDVIGSKIFSSSGFVHHDIKKISAKVELSDAGNFEAALEVELNSEEQDLFKLLCNKIEARVELKVK